MHAFRTGLAILMYTLASLFLLYEMAVQISPSVMTDQLMRDFRIGAPMLGVMSSLYFYSYALMQIPAGLLFDRFKMRVLLTLSPLIVALGAFLFGSCPRVGYAAFGRFLMGLGSSFAFVGVLTVASRWFPLRYFGFLVGIAQLLAALGALVGELFLAICVNRLGWSVVLLLLGSVGIVLAILCWSILRERPNGERRDPPQPHHLLRELGESIREKQTWWIALYAFSSWGSITLFAAFWCTPYFMVRYRIDNAKAAVACSVIWVGIAVAAPMVGWLSDKIGRRRSPLIACASIGLLSSLILLYTPSLSYFSTFPFLFGIGVAAGGQVLTFTLVKEINHPMIFSTAVGLNNMAVVAGGVVLQPCVGFLLDLFWSGEVFAGVPVYSSRDYLFGLSLLPLCFLTALFSSLFFIRETGGHARYRIESR